MIQTLQAALPKVIKIIFVQDQYHSTTLLCPEETRELGDDRDFITNKCFKNNNHNIEYQPYDPYMID